jgi:hypothetical protein
MAMSLGFVQVTRRDDISQQEDKTWIGEINLFGKIAVVAR